MLINDNPTLQTAAETLYRLNMDERFWETCECFAQAEIEHNGLLQRNVEITQTNDALRCQLTLWLELCITLITKFEQILYIRRNILRFTNEC